MVKKKTTKNVDGLSASGKVLVKTGTVLKCDTGAAYDVGGKIYPLCLGKVGERDRALGFEKSNYNTFETVSGGTRRKNRKGKKQSRKQRRR